MKSLGMFGLLAAIANAYAPPLSRVRKRHLPAALRGKRQDAERVDAAEAKRARRAQRNLKQGL